MPASQFGRSARDKILRADRQREQDRISGLCQDCGSRLNCRDTDPDYCNRCVGWHKTHKAERNPA